MFDFFKAPCKLVPVGALCVENGTSVVFGHSVILGPGFFGRPKASATGLTGGGVEEGTSVTSDTGATVDTGVPGRSEASSTGLTGLIVNAFLRPMCLAIENVGLANSLVLYHVVYK